MSWFKAKRVVVPFDFSAESLEAVKVGLTLAESEDDVHVLFVLPELSAMEPGVVWGDINDETRRLQARKEMEKKLAGLNVNNVHLEVQVGNPGNSIAELAQKVGAGLIVIPSHGRTGMKRFVLGSVAERVVRLAHCPVLVLKSGNESASTA